VKRASVSPCYAAAVNDPTIDPRKGPDKMAAPNVGIVEVLVHGFPFMLHVALRDIEVGCCSIVS